MHKRYTLRVAAVSAAVLAAITLSATPALADPPSFKPLVGVGSDTTQDVVNGLASAISALGNYEATGTATIQTKSGGPFFARPNGSGQGVQALSASINSTGTKQFSGTTITGQVDFARSSSGPSVSGTELTWIPFARDAVTYAVNASSDFPRNLPLGSAATPPAALNLYNIYHCTATTYRDNEGELVTIRPLIPQSGSGTRSFWLGRVGLTEATIPTCVTSLGNTVQEHNGTLVTGAGDIVPFSIAQYIAQGNHASIQSSTSVVVTERRANIALGGIGGIKPMVPGAAGAELNGDFPVNRLVYNVVATSRLGDTDIAGTFVGTGSTVCSNGAIIRQFGFATIGTACGGTSAKSGYTL